VPWLVAWYFDWIHAWEQRRRRGDRDLFERLAFVTRYSSTGFWEAMEIPLRDLGLYCEALAKIISEENRPLPSATGR